MYALSAGSSKDISCPTIIVLAIAFEVLALILGLVRACCSSFLCPTLDGPAVAAGTSKGPALTVQLPGNNAAASKDNEVVRVHIEPGPLTPPVNVHGVQPRK